MTTARMEAFSDGVIAIIITVMVLEMRALRGTDITALRPLIPVFLSYLLSFVFLGIYWSNHHHLLQVAEHVNGSVLWANLHLLFWLSLTPFVTNWMGENQFAAWPVALYGGVLLCAAIAYFILVRTLLSLHGLESVLATALGRDFKGKISIVFGAAIGPRTSVNAPPAPFTYLWQSCGWYPIGESSAPWCNNVGNRFP